MAEVQAQIHILVDIHAHDGGTAKLAALPPAERELFLRHASEAVHGDRLAEFLLLSQSSVFRPVLTFEAGTKQPSLLHINAAMVEAIVAYNERAFGLTFDTDFEASGGAQLSPVPHYACVQWVWIDGEWVRKYNYDLTILDETAHSEGELHAAYRVALSYPSEPPDAF